MSAAKDKTQKVIEYLREHAEKHFDNVRDKRALGDESLEQACLKEEKKWTNIMVAVTVLEGSVEVDNLPGVEHPSLSDAVASMKALATAGNYGKVPDACAKVGAEITAIREQALAQALVRSIMEHPGASAAVPPATFDHYEKTHKFVMERAQAAGVKLAVRSAADRTKFVVPRSDIPWEPAVDNAFNHHYKEHVPEPLTAADEASSRRVGSLQANLSRYYQEIGEATEVFDEVVHLASIEGAEDFAKKTDVSSTLRVWLESEPTKSACLSLYGATFGIEGLEDSGVPTTTEPSLTAEQFDRLMEGIQLADGYLNAGKPLLVHCSMGQSRSAMFVVVLLVFRASRNKIPEVAELTADKTLEWAINKIGTKRNLIRIDTRWFTLLMSLAEQFFG